ncbi:MAG: GNAT family N-acetyltransferase [Phycisphaerae bacterium]|nr:GNAT family N-acetyltransferase [Phycisphaerae bacterium]
MPGLALADVARLEELRQARGLAEVADEALPIAGGIAGRSAPGLSTNNSNAIGLDQPVTDADIDRLCDWHESRASEPRTEVAPFAHPSVLEHLEARRFVLRFFEMVFFRGLDPGQPAAAPHPVPPGLLIRAVDPADAREVREYSRVVMSGFFPPDQQPSEDDYALSARVVAHPRTVCLAAWLDGALVAGGAMDVSGEVAGLFGLSVLPDQRRRGVQLALIAARLNEAARRGARVATIGTRPGIATERNARRMGFQLAYAKAVMCRPGPGLARARG